MWPFICCGSLKNVNQPVDRLSLNSDMSLKLITSDGREINHPRKDKNTFEFEMEKVQ